MKLALPTLTLGILLAIAACADRDAEDAASSTTAPPAPELAARDDREDSLPGTSAPGSAAGDSAPADGPASYRGFAGAEFGMDAAQVRAVWDGELEGGPGDGPGAESASCFHLGPAGQPSMGYFALMFGEDGFARYSVANDQMTAPGGGRRGMDDAEIVQLYGDGKVERQPHKYSDGEYLRIRDPAGSDAVLIFETDAEGTVTEWRVGLPPQVDYVEGCA